jgi:hypothetical protein
MPIARRYILVTLGGGKVQPLEPLGSHLETAFALTREWHRATMGRYLAIADTRPQLDERPGAEPGWIIGWRLDIFQDEFKPIALACRRDRCPRSVDVVQVIREQMIEELAAVNAHSRPRFQPMQRNVLARRNAVPA